MGNGVSSFQKTLYDIEQNDTTLNHLDFSNSHLGDAKLRKLCERLHHNT